MEGSLDPVFIENQHGMMAMLKGGATVFMPHDPDYLPNVKPVTPYQLPYMELNIDNVMMWGDDNNFPQNIYNLYSQTTLVNTTLSRIVSQIIENGIFACEVIGYEDDGTEITKPVIDPEIEMIINSIGSKKYMYQITMDLVWYFNAFSEMILNKARTKIVALSAKRASDCRWERMNEGGISQNIYINANWQYVNSRDSRYVTKAPAIDPHLIDPIDLIRKGNSYNYIYPLTYPTPGRRFYQLAYHDSIRTSGWLDVYMAIPEFKKYMMQNQMHIKYHWKVDAEYWVINYGESYQNGTPETRRQTKLDWLKKQEAVLTNVNNAGNSILTDRIWDISTKGYRDLIELVSIDDIMKDGKYISDNHEAGANILYALGVDPTDVGFISGASGARSGGSDKREAWLISKSRLNPYRDFIVEHFMFALRYNGTYDKYQGRLRLKWHDTMLTTVDKSPTGLTKQQS
jgi:hypothetical protein